ncbi:gp91 [Sphingomonas phage PAU]|uniref:gp91 n=1 Tax=Sphingomonas phage PAU TaxID=1150991 RepID=UPI00025731E5|nr:gp91 [Sphingomonas phage PAU]AFF28089.1 gp91 [Sphingomonas phage PAU]
MKKLSTTLKQSSKALNESAIDSKESFFRFGMTALSMSKGADYTDEDSHLILTNIYESSYPNYSEMIQELTKIVMTDSQKSKKAGKLITEIFTDLANNPNVSSFYHKLSQAMSYDTIATVECYVNNLALISEQINVTDIDLTKYLTPTCPDIQPVIEMICSPTHAMQVVESALLLYSYILANNTPDIDLGSFKQFYTDIIQVYNEFKTSFEVYSYDITTAKNFFQTTLSFKDPTFYLSADKLETNVSESMIPLFLGSFMNIFWEGYLVNSEQLIRRVDVNVLHKFENTFTGFLKLNKLFVNELFRLDQNNLSSTRLKQLYYLGLQLAAKVKDMSTRRLYMDFLNVSKDVIDELTVIESRLNGILSTR